MSMNGEGTSAPVVSYAQADAGCRGLRVRSWPGQGQVRLTLDAEGRADERGGNEGGGASKHGGGEVVR